MLMLEFYSPILHRSYLYNCRYIH